MNNQLQPITHTEEFLAAVLDLLTQIKDGLIGIESELQKLNQSATQKQPIQVQLDAIRLSEAIEVASAKHAKSQMKR